MRRRAAREGGARIAGRQRELDFQLLWHQVAVRTRSDEVCAALDYLVQSAAHPFTPRARLVFDVEPTPQGYLVREQGDLLGTLADPLSVMDAVYSRAHQWAFELASLAGWVRQHGALVDVGDRRVLVVGPPGSGKTTLAARLLLDGADVPGDESVLVRTGASLAVPRRFHLKPGTLDLLPELRGLAEHLPRVGDPPVRALDPRSVSGRWRLTVRAIDAVVLLEPERSSGTRIEAADATGVMQRLVDETFVALEDRATVVRETAAILRTASVDRLWVDDPGDASALIRARFGVQSPADASTPLSG